MMNRTRTRDDLLEAFGREGCPVCRLALRRVESYLESISREGGLVDLSIRDRIRAAHGFCNEHAHQWLEQQHLLGTAIIYEDVLGHIADELRGLRFERRGWLSGVTSLRSLGGSGTGNRGPDALQPHRECLACRALAEAEAAVLDTLLGSLQEPEFGRAYAGSAGLCVPHLATALGAARDESSFAALIEVALTRHEALREQLREIIRRHDYRYTGEAAGEERGAEARAVRHSVGERGIRGLSRLDAGR
ncbi:MAG: DUF6062 family protein [Chloroflexota bacterium]|nr:DUF6062 family protein [Chloroflexota bacterium]